MPQPKLEKPWTRRKLIVELAHSDKSQVRLAEEYGVTQSSISEFASRHRAEIDVVRADKENEFAGIAIADKANRLATYEDVLRRLTGALEDADLMDEKVANAIGKVLRNVAEELGHLPNRVTLGGEVGVTTNYKINGVDPENLR
jgi:predicted transcriptional regulator